jgi:hypothetical protein
MVRFLGHDYPRNVGASVPFDGDGWVRVAGKEQVIN